MRRECYELAVAKVWSGILIILMVFSPVGVGPAQADRTFVETVPFSVKMALDGIAAEFAERAARDPEQALLIQYEFWSVIQFALLAIAEENSDLLNRAEVLRATEGIRSGAGSSDGSEPLSLRDRNRLLVNAWNESGGDVAELGSVMLLPSPVVGAEFDLREFRQRFSREEIQGILQYCRRLAEELAEDLGIERIEMSVVLAEARRLSVLELPEVVGEPVSVGGHWGTDPGGVSSVAGSAAAGSGSGGALGGSSSSAGRRSEDSQVKRFVVHLRTQGYKATFVDPPLLLLGKIANGVEAGIKKLEIAKRVRSALLELEKRRVERRAARAERAEQKQAERQRRREEDARWREINRETREHNRRVREQQRRERSSPVYSISGARVNEPVSGLQIVGELIFAGVAVPGMLALAGYLVVGMGGGLVLTAAGAYGVGDFLEHYGYLFGLVPGGIFGLATCARILSRWWEEVDEYEKRRRRGY